jgi:hypothetical protein
LPTPAIATRISGKSNPLLIQALGILYAITFSGNIAKLKGSFEINTIGAQIMNESELTVKYEPFKEIVVMERNFFSTPDELARFTSIIAGGKPAGLYWAEGVVFLYFPLPASTEAAAKALIEDRRIYWTFVGYAFMPKYQLTIETKEKIIVPVIDMSANPIFRKVAVWLKEQK